MVKRLTLILVAALIVGLAVPAFAEVQNIKVSGDILLRGVARDRFDLNNGGGGENILDDSMAHVLSTVRLRVDADLTDNVSATVRLINERVWGQSWYDNQGSGAGATGAETIAGDNLVELDLGYITLKEFLYSPLTLVLGRQPLRYGMGFIVGDPDTNQFSEYNHYGNTAATVTQVDTIVPEDLSSLKAFDAARAILDYNPLVIDIIYAKINEGVVLGTTAVGENDDVNLYGVNAGYNWGTDKNIQQEVYVFAKEIGKDGGVGGQTTYGVAGNDYDRTVTVGTRASIEPMERLFIAGEVAWQSGKKYVPAQAGITTYSYLADRDAFAAQAIAQLALDMKYSPVLGIEFTHYSGDNYPNGIAAPELQEIKDYEAWDPMFEDQAGGRIYNALFSSTNCNILTASVSLMPIEDVTLKIEFSNLILDEEFNVYTTSWTPSDYATYTVVPGEDDLGKEVDVTLTYDYTEDVQFGLTAGLFIPGEVFSYVNNATAMQTVGSVKVTF